MKKELLLAFLSVAINVSAANDEIVKAGSTAVPMPQYAVFTDGLHDDIVPVVWPCSCLEWTSWVPICQKHPAVSWSTFWKS